MIRAVVLMMVVALGACVQTGQPRFEPDYAEAARINTRLGMDYLQQGRVELAQFKFEKALKQDDSLAATHLGMARVHEHFEEMRQAAEFYEQAMDRAPKDSTIQTHYASFLCGYEGLDSARRYFEKAIASKRNSLLEFSHTQWAQCLLQHDEFTAAETQLRQALQIKPRYAPALLGMARLSYQRGDFLRARAFLQRFEAVATRTVDSLLLGLRIEYQLGDEAVAAAYAAELKRRAPGIENRIDLTSGRAW